MTIPLSVPHMYGLERDYVLECIETGWVSSAGPFVARLEQTMAERLDGRACAALVNGTSALALGLRLVGVRAGDAVITSPLTFVATGNAIAATGAQPRFCDVAEAHWTLDPAALERMLRGARRRGGASHCPRTGARIAAIVPVHLFGIPCDADRICAIAGEAGIPVVLDACEGLGTRIGDRAGAAYGDVSCSSFNGNKLITAGGGGILSAADPALAARARHLSQQARCDAVAFLHDAIGTNARMPNLNAAFAVAQLERLELCLAERRLTAQRYDRALLDVPDVVRYPRPAHGERDNWLYSVLVPAARRDPLLRFLKARGVEARPFFVPLDRLGTFPGRGGSTEVAQAVAARGINLPSSFGLGPDGVEAVVSALTEGLRGADA